MVYVYHKRQDTEINKLSYKSGGGGAAFPINQKINMKQTINLDVAAKKLAKVNSLLNEVNNTLQDLLVNVQELDNDYSNKSFDLCQSYCQLADEIGAAIMQEKVLEVLDKKQL